MELQPLKDPLLVVKDCLATAYHAVHGGGEALKATTSTATDIATRGDEIAGEAMIAYLRTVPQIGVAYTEEQGKVVLSETGSYSAIIDDIDGTKNFKEGWGMLPHGSIVGVFEGRDPLFNDGLAAGYLDFPSRRMFHAARGQGTFATTLGHAGEPARVRTTGRKQLYFEKNLTLLPDIYMLGDLAPAFMEYSAKAWLGDFRTSAAQLALVAAGSADIFVTAGDNAFNKKKIKMGEELGPGYLLVTEAGGAIVDWFGLDLGSRRIDLGNKKPWHAIAAATPELAVEFSRDMRKKPAIAQYMESKGMTWKIVEADIGR